MRQQLGNSSSTDNPAAKEDHTLGNALRMSLLRDKEVKFAGYRMPHPLQFVCEMKVQTNEGVKPINAVVGAIQALEEEFSQLENQMREHLPGQDIVDLIMGI